MTKSKTTMASMTREAGSTARSTGPTPILPRYLRHKPACTAAMKPVRGHERKNHAGESGAPLRSGRGEVIGHRPEDCLCLGRGKPGVTSIDCKDCRGELGRLGSNVNEARGASSRGQRHLFVRRRIRNQRQDMPRPTAGPLRHGCRRLLCLRRIRHSDWSPCVD